MAAPSHPHLNGDEERDEGRPGGHPPPRIMTPLAVLGHYWQYLGLTLNPTDDADALLTIVRITGGTSASSND